MQQCVLCVFSKIVLRVIHIGELFFHIFHVFFRAIFQSSIFSFSCFFFSKYEFRKKNSEGTPPYIGTYLQLFPNFGNYGKNALR